MNDEEEEEFVDEELDDVELDVVDQLSIEPRKQPTVQASRAQQQMHLTSSPSTTSSSPKSPAQQQTMKQTSAPRGQPTRTAAAVLPPNRPSTNADYQTQRVRFVESGGQSQPPGAILPNKPHNYHQQPIVVMPQQSKSSENILDDVARPLKSSATIERMFEQRFLNPF